MIEKKVENVMEIHKKSWGHELWIVNNDEYCGKLLSFRAGTSCSIHHHRLKDEVFFLQSGLIDVKYSDKDFTTYDTPGINKLVKIVRLYIGESFHVYPGLRHQICAVEKSELFEFSTHHEDSDSYRVEA